MATNASELNDFTAFARAKLATSPDASLEDCFHEWRSLQHAASDENENLEPPFSKMKRLGLIGSVKGPSDLSTNPKYMEGFGES